MCVCECVGVCVSVCGCVCVSVWVCMLSKELVISALPATCSFFVASLFRESSPENSLEEREPDR